MSNEFKFKIGDEAVKTIIDLRDQEPGDKEYALFLQIDGVHGNQFTYDLSFLDVNQARSDDVRIDFGDLPVIIASLKNLKNLRPLSLKKNIAKKVFIQQLL